MALPQQKYRELIFQLLYSYDLGKAKEEDMHPLLMKELAVTRKALREAQDKVDLIRAHESTIDATIAKTSSAYAFERIQSVERNILRLGTYELLYDKEIPPKVAITEAMRLARKFGTPESAAFVNAILDHIFKSSQGIKLDSESLSKASKALMQSEEHAKEAAQHVKEEETTHDDD